MYVFQKKMRPRGQILHVSWQFVLSKFILHTVLCGKMIGTSLGGSECYSARCTGLGEKEGFWQILCTCLKNEEVTNITLLELYLLFDCLFEHVWNPFGFSFGRAWCFQDAKYLFKRKQTQQNVAKPSLRTNLGLEKHKQVCIFRYGFGHVGHVILISINSGDSNVLLGSILYICSVPPFPSRNSFCPACVQLLKNASLYFVYCLVYSSKTIYIWKLA